jgi:hypothetical protein
VELVQLAAIMVLIIVLPMVALAAFAARTAGRARAVLLEVERDNHLHSGVFPVQWTTDPQGAPAEGMATPRQAVRSMGYQLWTRFEATDTGMSQRVDGELYRNEDATLVVELARAWPNAAAILDDPRVTAMPEAVQAAFADRIRPTTEPSTACTFTSLVINDDGTMTRLATTSAAGGPLVEHPGFRLIHREDMTPVSLVRAHEAEIDGRATKPIPDDPAAFLDGEQDLLAAHLEANGWLGPPDEQGRRHFTVAHWEMVTDAARG